MENEDCDGISPSGIWRIEINGAVAKKAEEELQVAICNIRLSLETPGHLFMKRGNVIVFLW